MLDVHTHFLAPDVVAPSQAAIDQGWPVVVDRGDEVDVYQLERLVRVLDRSAWDVTERLRVMDRLGVDAQVVMPTPFTFLYDADPEIAATYARAQNDRLAGLVEAGRGRIHGLGSLPLQDPDAAVAEARRVRGALALSGVEIGTHADRFQLHDPLLEPVFAELERLGAAVFVHPWKPPERAAHHGLAFGLGRPVETELAVGSLLFGGCLERHPALRVCLAHGGGGIPALRGRLHNGWSRLEPSLRVPAEDPRRLLTRIWADGLTYDAEALALAESTFGPNRMVVGSDIPFAAQESPIAASYATAESRGLIESGWAERATHNALAFLGAERPDPTSRSNDGEYDSIGATR